MRSTGATADRKTRTTRAKLLAHRFISPNLPAFSLTSLPFPFDVPEIRLSNVHVASDEDELHIALSNVYSYCDRNGNRNMLCHILEKSNFSDIQNAVILINASFVDLFIYFFNVFFSVFNFNCPLIHSLCIIVILHV